MQNKITTTQIQVGFRFKHKTTERVYEVTKVSEASVWFKDIDRTPIWRQSKNTLLLSQVYIAL